MFVVMTVCVVAAGMLFLYSLPLYGPGNPLVLFVGREQRQVTDKPVQRLSYISSTTKRSRFVTISNSELIATNIRELTSSFPKKTCPTSSTTEKANVSTTPGKPFLPCDWNVYKIITRETRLQAVLHCNKTSADIVLREVNAYTTPVTTLTANDTSCLKRVIKDHCSDVSLRVPRVAHYVWFGDNSIPLYSFVSVLSVVRFLRPCLVLFHGDIIPSGIYWHALLQLVPNVIFVQRTRPRHIYGNVINVVEHSADVTRLQILIDYGGVYVDTDQYLLRPVDALLNHSVVIGTEVEGVKCGNGLIFSEPQAPFLKLWLASYVTFNDAKWGEHSTSLPYNMSRVFSHLVTVVDSFFRPNFEHIEPLYLNRSYDWSDLHALHLYYRFYFDYFRNYTRLDEQDNVIGDMTRYILFGSRDSCFEQGTTTS
ncbi:hypothetical protein V1264_022049 [Littorina saxatilis]|uniref:Alpha-1,4-N-acetylglucosaminyltransferase n=2 Tax=Littorina saxatilis TaxID=31220 RepID=A0AAN9FX67_9CAEN